MKIYAWLKMQEKIKNAFEVLKKEKIYESVKKVSIILDKIMKISPFYPFCHFCLDK